VLGPVRVRVRVVEFSYKRLKQYVLFVGSRIKIGKKVTNSKGRCPRWGGGQMSGRGACLNAVFSGHLFINDRSV